MVSDAKATSRGSRTEREAQRSELQGTARSIVAAVVMLLTSTLVAHASGSALLVRETSATGGDLGRHGHP